MKWKKEKSKNYVTEKPYFYFPPPQQVKADKILNWKRHNIYFCYVIKPRQLI
jgi:hypothetical protein